MAAARRPPHILRAGVTAADVTPSESDWRGGRAGSIRSQRPGFGRGGWSNDDLPGEATRSEHAVPAVRQAGPFTQ